MSNSGSPPAKPRVYLTAISVIALSPPLFLAKAITTLLTALDAGNKFLH